VGVRINHALTCAGDSVRLEVEEPILDGKVATELLAFITRDRMVAEDVNWVTTKGASLPTRVSLRMGMPKNQRSRRRKWFGGQAFPIAGEGGDCEPPCGTCSLLEGEADRVAAGDGGYKRSTAEGIEAVRPVFLGAVDRG
jgi:hypothetical protein